MDTEQTIIKQTIIIEFTPDEAKALAEMSAGVGGLTFAPADVKARWLRLSNKINHAIKTQSSGQFFQCQACHA